MLNLDLLVRLDANLHAFECKRLWPKFTGGLPSEVVTAQLLSLLPVKIACISIRPCLIASYGFNVIANRVPMLFGKYYLIKTNFSSVLLLLYLHTEISCFDVKSSIFNNVSNASFGKEKQIKPHTSLHSTKDLLPTKSQQDI